MEKMSFSNKQTAFEYALYMIAASSFDKTLSKSKIIEQSMLVQYKEQKPDRQYEMEDFCIAYMDKISKKIPESFFKQNVEVHIVKGNMPTEIVFKGERGSAVFTVTFGGRRPKINCKVITPKQGNDLEKKKAV